MEERKLKAQESISSFFYYPACDLLLGGEKTREVLREVLRP